MNVKLDNNVRRALGLAVQILEDLPAELRPESNMEDMRGLLAGKSSDRVGRDNLLIIEAIATAIVWRTLEIVNAPPHKPMPADTPSTEVRAMYDVFERRINEFRTLFELSQQFEPSVFAMRYVESCERLALWERQQ